MSIRIRNLDLEVVGNKREHGVTLGDVTATINRTVFVAPIDLKINEIELFSNQAVSGASDSAQMSVVIDNPNATSSIWASRGTSGSTVGSTNAISANVAYKLFVTSTYDVSAGTMIRAAFTVAASGAISGGYLRFRYTPLLHKNTR